MQSYITRCGMLFMNEILLIVGVLMVFINFCHIFDSALFHFADESIRCP